jgi:hypothetical protein
MTSVAKKKKTADLKCKTPGCKRAHHAQGYCQNCYDNLRKKKSSEKMKSNTNHKKQAAAPAKAEKEQKVKEPVAELAATPAGTRTRTRKGANGAPPAAQSGTVEALKAGRLGLIKARHEAMKREIDQIREDLESDEDE